MRFVIYKNSILASLCSMFGAAFITLAVISLINGELDILSGIGLVAVGLGLMWLASVISERKAKRKLAKAKQAAAKAAAANAGYAQPVKPVQPTKPVQPVKVAQPTKTTQTAQVNNQDVQKKIQAYKDLLECGILTQEECDQKIRELLGR